MGFLSSFNFLNLNDEPIKNEMLEITQHNRFYVKMECLAFSSSIYIYIYIYIYRCESKGETFGQRIWDKMNCYWEHPWEIQWELEEHDWEPEEHH
jgi:hypothetical protein